MTNRTAHRKLRELSPSSASELLPALRPDEAEAWEQNVIRVNLPKAEPQGSFVVERREPRRKPTVESDVNVPVRQAAITALVVGLSAGALTWVFGWSWRVPIVVTTLTLAWAWLWRMGLMDDLLWHIESMTGRDLDNDKQIGRPLQHEPVLVNSGQARRTVQKAARAQATETQRGDLLAFLGQCYLKGTSEKSHGVKASGPSREQYVRQRDQLLKLGLAKWRNPERPKGGWVLVTDAETAAQVIANHVL